MKVSDFYSMYCYTFIVPGFVREMDAVRGEAQEHVQVQNQSFLWDLNMYGGVLFESGSESDSAFDIKSYLIEVVWNLKIRKFIVVHTNTS